MYTVVRVDFDAEVQKTQVVEANVRWETLKPEVGRARA